MSVELPTLNKYKYNTIQYNTVQEKTVNATNTPVVRFLAISVRPLP